MKYWLAIALGIIFITISVGSAHAATFLSSTDSNGSIVVNSPANDLHVFGNNVIVNAPVGGDLLAFGETILITSPAQDDEFLVGNNITAQGAVGHDLRVAGNNVTISSTVTGNTYIAGASVTIAKDAVINGDLFIAANAVKIDGTVKGTVHLATSQTTLSGTTGAVSGRSGDLTVNSTAVINGNLSYQADSPASIASGSKITGKTSYSKLTNRNYTQSILTFILILIGKIILVGLLVTLWPKFWAKTIDRYTQNFLPTFGFGLLTLIAGPILIIILLATFIGIPLAIVGLIAWIGLLIVGSVASKVFIGSWLSKLLKLKDIYQVSWLSAALGVTTTSLVGLIPFLGPLANFLLIVIGIGAIVSMIRFDRSVDNTT